MERILEPEYMDTDEEANSYDAMDHSAANRAFVERLLEVRTSQSRGLDLGTGPGDIPILLAGSVPGLRVLAVDAAARMLALARSKVAAAGLSGRVELQQADVKALPLADGAFDLVFSNTILHHIPQPEELLREAWRVCAPGGVLFVRDLYRPATEAEAWALVDRHAAGATEPQRRLLFDSLHAALTLAEAKAVTAAAGIEGASVAMTSDRHYTIECVRAA